MTDRDPHNSMQHRIIRTKDVENGYGRGCVTCNHEFKAGEDRHEWRLNLSDQTKFHAGSFWNTHCHECFVKTMVSWRDTLIDELNDLPSSMKGLV